MATGTRERLLRAAGEAVARFGLAKLELSDVSSTAGVSRATIYRYFASREDLLAAWTEHEALLFKDRMLAAIAATSPGADRMRTVLEHATRHVSEHAALQRLIETDPALVLRGLRERFRALTDDFRPVLEPLLTEVDLVRSGVVTADDLLDWLLRLMISAYLLPLPHPDLMARGLTSVYRYVAASPRRAKGRSAGGSSDKTSHAPPRRTLRSATPRPSRSRATSIAGPALRGLATQAARTPRPLRPRATRPRTP